MNGQQFFNRLIDSKEKSSLLKSLVKTRVEIRAKIAGQNTVHITRAFEIGDDCLNCTLPSSVNEEDDKYGHVVFSFILDGERYFMESDYKIIGEDMVVDFPKDIFRLQRRNHFRVQIPGSCKVLLETSLVNGESFRMTVPVLDLSAGGCKIKVDSSAANSAFSKKSEFTGRVYLPDRTAITISGQVRYSMKGSPDGQTLMVGVQFSNLNEKDKNRIGTFVMDIYREYFFKYK